MLNNQRSCSFPLICVLVFGLFCSPAFATQGIEVDVTFNGSFGTTITNETGTYFNVNINKYFKHYYGYNPYGTWQYWVTLYEPKIYTQAYHVGNSDFIFNGTVTLEDAMSDPSAGVPMYFFGNEAKVLLAIKNNGKQAKAKVRVASEAFSLNTDGSNGMSYGNKMIRDVVIPRGETVYINADFITQYSEGMGTGLNRFLIDVSHANNAKDNNNRNGGSSLIGAYEAIFCPPDVSAQFGLPAPVVFD